MQGKRKWWQALATLWTGLQALIVGRGNIPISRSMGRNSAPEKFITFVYDAGPVKRITDFSGSESRCVYDANHVRRVTKEPPQPPEDGAGAPNGNA